MNAMTHFIAEKIKESLETPTATAITAGSTAVMGWLEVFYHVSQDLLGWISLALGVIIGVVVLRIKLIELKMKQRQEKLGIFSEEKEEDTKNGSE